MNIYRKKLIGLTWSCISCQFYYCMSASCNINVEMVYFAVQLWVYIIFSLTFYFSDLALSVSLTSSILSISLSLGLSFTFFTNCLSLIFLFLPILSGFPMLYTETYSDWRSIECQHTHTHTLMHKDF